MPGALAQGAEPDSFSVGQVWKFDRVNGKGSFELGKDGETPIGTLSFDFSEFPGGQRYVMASKEVDIASGAQLSFRARAGEPRKLAVRLVDSTGQIHQHKRDLKKSGEWEAFTISLTGNSEHWKGANDGAVHFPIKTIVLITNAGKDGSPAGKVEFSDLKVGGAPISAANGAVPQVPAAAAPAPDPAGAKQAARQKIEGYHEFNPGTTAPPKPDASGWVQTITVSEPVWRSELKGDVTVKFQAPGMTSAQALCWSQPDGGNASPWGHDVDLTPGGLKLGAGGSGSFVFPADKFPNGPVNVRILASNESGQKDVFELQLFNLGGVKWKQGIPNTTPPGAEGLKLVFSDDFDGPLSISNDGRGTRYNAHKPRFGDFSGWPFSNVLGDGKPFSQIGTWLRISARKDAESPKGRTGIIASVDMDGKGFWAKPPFYMECRFTAQSAPGTWPAFWTLTHLDRGVPADELDIVEAYGGVGRGNPNHPGYSIVSHFWRQNHPDGSKKKAFSAKPQIMELGGKSYWSATFHTYGVRVGLDETVYYFDDIEVLRHPTNDLSKTSPACFLINLAIGGISGWQIDLERYGNGSDMYVDYVRVFSEAPIDYSQPPVQK